MKRLHLKSIVLLAFATLHMTSIDAANSPMDVAPFGMRLPEGDGLYWEEPREIHRVVVHFKEPVPSLDKVRLEYWGSRWPEQRLPKNREPGGGDVGWMELGNWYNGGWRLADTDAKTAANAITFTFRPVNAKEYAKLTKYPAEFRYTLKLRVKSSERLPAIERIEAFTDSVWEERSVKIAFAKVPPNEPQIEAFNGSVKNIRKISAKQFRIDLQAASNSDPNTFDRTLVTVRGNKAFTFSVDDLSRGPLFLPDFGVAVLKEDDTRDYETLAREQKASGTKTLYDRIADMPEQTWPSAWTNMPPKKSSIYFPMALDGGRQKFRLDANGSFVWRCNDGLLQARPGKDTPRFALEKAYGRFEFDLPSRPAHREIEESSIPICHTTWEREGLRIQQTAFVTQLDGTKENGSVPPADALAVCVAQFRIENISRTNCAYHFPVRLKFGDSQAALQLDDKGFLLNGKNIRGHISGIPNPHVKNGTVEYSGTLIPAQSLQFTLKVPYVVLASAVERDALSQLDYNREYTALANYWRSRLDQSARLITPEPLLNEYYRAHAGHLLINCEREPKSTRRFARVGSFTYGAYGNESCMMVVDLDRRGYHKEAEECLDAWLHYQGSVALPGDFSTQDGVLYGAGGYEMGGYNQHHGWILWMFGEHFRFTRDTEWLKRAAPGIVKGADWIIRETHRTANRHELERGLLPASSLEDIGDWWTWLSTSCYTWRGLDSAAWSLEQINHSDAKRLRIEADAYRNNLLRNFHAAAERSPVVRLRDGTAVPHFPSYVHRRGRSFGWICETLEGALHLLITGAIAPDSPEAKWILNDYEDNLYLSNQYGYVLDDFDKWWFGRGGMSMQACLLLDVEPYLYRDDVKHALRGIFNAIAVSHFPDVHLNTEHALPQMGDWRGDHYKSSDEANACGWLRHMFVRENGDELLLGQAVPREWLAPGQKCGLENARTYFGKTSILYTSGQNEITAQVNAPERNVPEKIRVRFRTPNEAPIRSVTVNGKRWRKIEKDWVELPGNINMAEVRVRY